MLLKQKLNKNQQHMLQIKFGQLLQQKMGFCLYRTSVIRKLKKATTAAGTLLNRRINANVAKQKD